jgi:hypothetical protein
MAEVDSSCWEGGAAEEWWWRPNKVRWMISRRKSSWSQEADGRSLGL